MTLLPLLALACSGPSDDTSDAPEPTDSGEDTASGDGWNCSGTLDDAASVDATDVTTVLRANWVGQEGDVLRFYDSVGTLRDAPSTLDDEGMRSALLLGLSSEQDVWFRVARPDGDTWACGPVEQATNGRIPAALPELTFSGSGTGVSGYMVSHVITASNEYAVIIDSAGKYVWSYEVLENIRAVMARDGNSVIVGPNSTTVGTPSELIRVGLDGTVLEAFDVPMAHTDFVELPDGSFATLGWVIEEAGDGSVRWLGDTILLVATDGTVTELWNVFDWFEPDPTVVWREAELDAGEGPPLMDWSHINGITFSESERAFYVTSSFNQGVMKIDAITGDLLWLLADDSGEFDTLAPEGERFLNLPHSVEAIGDTNLLVFNRGQPENDGECAYATEFNLNFDELTVSEGWQYSSEDCLLVTALGEARRLSDFTTVVTFSTAGQIDRVNSDRELLWRVNLDVGGVFGFGGWTDSLYPR